MTYFVTDPIQGATGLDQVIAAPTNLKDLNLVAGLAVRVYDPVWGPGEAIFARAGGSIRLYGLCVYTPVWDATNQCFQMNMTECPNTANLGRNVFVYQGNTAITVGQYGWFLQTGVTPVNGTASVAADTNVGITGAGQIGADAATKGIQNMRSMQAATATVAKAGVSASGDNVIYFPSGTQGMFAGQYASGTNVGAAAIVSAVYPDRVTVTVVSSAAVASTVTMTNNNGTIYYNEVYMNRASGTHITA